MHFYTLTEQLKFIGQLKICLKFKISVRTENGLNYSYNPSSSFLIFYVIWECTSQYSSYLTFGSGRIQSLMHLSVFSQQDECRPLQLTARVAMRIWLLITTSCPRVKRFDNRMISKSYHDWKWWRYCSQGVFTCWYSFQKWVAYPEMVLRFLNLEVHLSGHFLEGFT